MNFPSEYHDVFSAVISASLIAIVSFFWKSVKSLQKIEGSMKEHNELFSKVLKEIGLLSRRVDVHDEIVGDLIGKSFNSRRISEGLEQRPNISGTKIPRRDS